MTSMQDSVTLTLKLTKSSESVSIRYDIHNGRGEPVLVFNRLWTGAAGAVADSQKIYRFVDARGLRLLVGAAPLPQNPVAFKNLPETTRIEAYGDFGEEISLTSPVTEYNVYFQTAKPDERSPQVVHQVELFVGYAPAKGIETTASRIHPGAFETLNDVAFENYRVMRSGTVDLTLDTLRQTGRYSRLQLPNEPITPRSSP